MIENKSSDGEFASVVIGTLVFSMLGFFITALAGLIPWVSNVLGLIVACLIGFGIGWILLPGLAHAIIGFFVAGGFALAFQLRTHTDWQTSALASIFAGVCFLGGFLYAHYLSKPKQG